MKHESFLRCHMMLVELRFDKNPKTLINIKTQTLFIRSMYDLSLLPQEYQNISFSSYKRTFSFLYNEMKLTE
jgi:hypothetical protein